MDNEKSSSAGRWVNFSFQRRGHFEQILEKGKVRDKEERRSSQNVKQYVLAEQTKARKGSQVCTAYVDKV